MSIQYVYFFYKEPVKLRLGSMFLFFEGFQPENVLILPLFSMKYSYLLKVTSSTKLFFAIK